MLPVDDFNGVSSSDQVLINLAVDIGIDPSNAADVLGAVMSYCSSRHGTTELSPGYLQFLTVRSACSAHGLTFTRDAVTKVVHLSHPRERFLVSALFCSRDASSLYDMYRRGLLYPTKTNLSSQGHGLHVDLRRIKAGPSEDHPLAWRPALKQMAEWITDWREGNDALRLVLVQEGERRLTAQTEMRDWLTGLVRQQETSRGVAPAEFYWDGGVD